MPEYLSKEEIRKWRSSLERITLEEYAARLGKVIQSDNHDDSLVDSVMLRSLDSMSIDKYTPKAEKIQSLAIKSFNKEKEITEKKETKPSIKKEVAVKKEAEPVLKKVVEKAQPKTKAERKIDNVNFSFKKALTSREQLVFNHFLENRNTIVYAKDLAKILELPRDYVYKYIKNLRAKIDGEALKNADKGGFVLTL